MNKDKIYNKEFVSKFNLALLELNNDEMGLSLFCSQVMPVFRQFAKQNNMEFYVFMNKVLKVERLQEKELSEGKYG